MLDLKPDHYDRCRQVKYIVERPNPKGLSETTKKALRYINGFTEVDLICNLIIAGGSQDERMDDVCDSIISDIMSHYDNIGGKYDMDSYGEDLEQNEKVFFELQTTVVEVIEEVRKIMRPVISLIAKRGDVLDVINVSELSGDAYRLTVVYNDERK